MVARRPLANIDSSFTTAHMTMAPYDVLRRALSAERLSTRENRIDLQPDVTAESLYLWNMRMCSAVMPVHLCEVVTHQHRCSCARQAAWPALALE
jgi:hypothetical protein